MLLTILIFFILLSVLVLIHELGHFVVAKKLGIRVDEFGLGLPPRIFGKKIGETTYSINWLPIGGFVKLYGEEGEENEELIANGKKQNNNSRAFYSRPPWQRALVLIAGVTMNFTLAVLVLSFLFTQGVLVPVRRVHIEAVEPGSVAAAAGFLRGDVMVDIDGQAVVSSQEFSDAVRERAGTPVAVTILRGASFVHQGEGIEPCPTCESLTLTVVPRTNPPLKKMEEKKTSLFTSLVNSIREFMGISVTQELPEREGPLGVAISSLETRIYPWYQAPFLGAGEAVRRSWELVSSVGELLARVILRQPVKLDVAGPVGIAQVTGQAVNLGYSAVLELLALLSLNLAIINILPFPALDGGRLFFVVIEGVFRKKVKEHYERVLHQAGMLFLLILILMVTINDIARILRVGP